MRKLFFYFISFLLFNSGGHLLCLQPKVTIWVHGTHGNAIFPNNNPKIQSSLDIWDACPQGLHHFSEINWVHQVRPIGEHLSKHTEFPKEHLYVFGWSGALDSQMRIHAGCDLFAAIKDLILSYQKDGHDPVLTIISHSHGGNVVLNMATCCSDEMPFIIDRTILLACPVQKQNAHLSQHPLFKKIYSIHSHADFVQILDPQGLHPLAVGIKEAIAQLSFKPLQTAWIRCLQSPFFSERHFPPNEKVFQAHVRWKDVKPWTEEDITFFPKPVQPLIKTMILPLKRPHSLLHLEFLLPSFIHNFIGVFDQIISQESSNPKPLIYPGKQEVLVYI